MDVNAGIFAAMGRLWLQMPGEVATARRVAITGPVQMAEIRGQRQRAVPVRDLAGGQHLAPTAELIDASPLSRAEVAEYDRLDAQLAGTIGDRRTLIRFNGLRLRALMFGELAA